MKADRTIIDKARALAIDHHRFQRYGKDFTHVHHLTAVAGLVSLHSTDVATNAAAWLHDIVEDPNSESDFTVEDIMYAYGDDIGGIVDRVTDPAGLGRFEAKKISLPRASGDIRSSIVKLADRYCNHAFTILTEDQKFAELYLGEFDFFMHTFYRAGREQMPLFRMVGAQQEQLRRLAELRLVRAV
ncbi:HD domain-containing protein [Mesorhizobium sp. M8A.F.Ca.ET.021.01.1.1]|uniref:HD domain-containing protein n=1 Tax=Mesorhizobium sp. M8A.F.Ca.ET.021.01.1.1 TaxID=2496757 RepID=UPI000FCBC86B|nr:HD domain-containing protein [Mesorhizobium sp. M8A.F.Ca.ET.021.01.1.1]RUW57174.1 bifunctional (p)ppGpp synthetase/guanosine-3',5'-bis(diphosphate) 3'-pyrophosphohydrolase [Mesorhizobium sp. M8A.F.Ca.ET.021.01.1.1]